MKKTPKILPTYYKSLGTKIFRDTTALPFADGGPLNDRNIHGDLLPSVYASALGRYYSNGGKFLTAGGEFHKIYKNPEGDIIVNHPKEDKGKWDTINLTEKSGANTISEGVDATKQWHAENPNSYANGGMLKRADGSYSKRGLWDNIRANAGSGKEPTKDMLAQERKINNNYAEGGQLGPGDCGPGLRWDEATQSCVPATIIVEDENDPRYLEYLERQRLYEYSQLPNHVVKQMIVSDLAKNYIAKAEEPFNAKEEAEFYTKNFDDPEYTNDLVGPFGSAASKRTLTPEEFAAWKQSIPREALMGEYAAGKLADLTSKYPPSKYEIRESEIDTPWNYHIQQTDDQKKWTSPKTNFLEDKINREALRKVYPNLSDEQIDKWVIESRTQPSYISNTIDPRTNSSEWILGPGQMETISYEEGNSESTFVPKKFPEFNPPPTFTDPDTKVKGYYPEYMAETFGKNYTYLPIWDAPIPVEIETPPVVPTAKEAPVEEFTGPQYNTPGYKMSLPSYYLAHHNSSQLIPHARLTRSIQDNVVTRPGAKLVQKITGYDPAAIEGYYNEEGEFVPGEIARAQEEGRRIKFDGLSNIKDLKAQREYNAAFNEYEKAQQENSNTEQYIEKKTYADGGQLGPGDPPNWKHPNLSPERIAALKALHGDNIFGNVNPNDLLLYDLNKDLVDNAIEFKSFLDPTAKVSNKYVDESLTKDLKIRMSKQGYGLDTKTGNYFKIPDEVLKAIQEPEDDFIPIGPPGRIDIPKRDIIRFDNSTTPAPEYDAPGYYRDYPAITWQHHNSNQLIPHARPRLTEVRVPGLGAAVVQKITGYNKPAVEGYEDEEGNWIPGEIEKAEQEGRRINFQGANSLKDRKAQEEYNAAFDAYEEDQKVRKLYGQLAKNMFLPAAQHANGGQLKPDYSLPEDSFQQGGRGLKNSVYASSMGQYPATYSMGGAMNPGPGEKIVVYNGVQYKQNNSGNWVYADNNQPVTDPLVVYKLPYEGKPVGSAVVQGAPKPKPISPVTKKQEYNTIKNSPVIADQQKAEQLKEDITKQSVYYPEVDPNVNPTTIESQIDNALGNPKKKAELSATFGTDYGVDNFRHANAGRYTAEAISDMTGNIPYLSDAAGFLGSNLLGLGHEAKVMFSGMEDRPWSTVLQESGEDLYNNYVGSKVGASSMTPEEKTNYLIYLSNSNLLPDGVVSSKPGTNQYFKHGPTDKGSYNSNYAQGGAMNQYPDGGSIYTYAKRPGSYYQKDSAGNWFISNKGTGGQYVPIDDPSGQRTAALNKGAVVTMANPTPDKYSKVTPSYNKSGMVQSVAGRTEAERQPVQNEIAGQQFAQNMERDYAEATKNQLPQHEQPLVPQDWMWSIPTGLKTVGQLAALRIPYTGMTLGTAANTAGAIHGATQIPERVQDWQDVSAGNKTWQEALIKSMGTGLELGTGALEIGKGINMYKFNPTGTSLAGGEASKVIQPGVVTNPTTGLKQYGNTTLMDYVNLPVKRGLNSSYADASLLPEDQIPYLLPKEELVKRYPWQYMSKDQEILESFKSNVKVPQRPYEIPASHTTQEDIMARALGKPLPTRVSKASLEPKVYYDLDGNIIDKPYAFGGKLNYQYPDGGILGATNNLVSTTPTSEGPVIPGEQAIRDFYTNWYSKRTLPFEEIGNKQYEKTMKSILPAYNPESTLLAEINAEKVPYEVLPNMEEGATGALVYNKKGLPEKIELSESIMNNPKELNATMTHEERTRIMAPYADKVLPAEQNIIQPSIKTFKEGWGNVKDPESRMAAEATYDYITNPQEDNIQSMLFEIRQQKNLQPNQIITDEDIQNWKLEAEKNGELDKNNPNFNNALYSLFKVSKDNTSMKNLFNYIASNNNKPTLPSIYPSSQSNFT